MGESRRGSSTLPSCPRITLAVAEKLKYRLNSCSPTALLGTYFYSPSQEGYEAQVNDRLARWRAAQEKALGIEQTETLPDLAG